MTGQVNGDRAEGVGQEGLCRSFSSLCDILFLKECYVANMSKCLGLLKLRDMSPYMYVFYRFFSVCLKYFTLKSVFKLQGLESWGLSILYFSPITNCVLGQVTSSSI